MAEPRKAKIKEPRNSANSAQQKRALPNIVSGVSRSPGILAAV